MPISVAIFDMASLALLLGATYVGRSFSGDKRQLVPLIKGALAHQGAAFLDVISPCVAFNNHAGSTKSYDYIREHNEAVSRIDFISSRAEITVDYPEGEVVNVAQHDGSIMRLRKLHAGYDPTNRVAAMTYIRSGKRPAKSPPACSMSIRSPKTCTRT